MIYSKELLEKLYKDLVSMRKSEEKLVHIYREGIVPGHIHSGIGQEAFLAGTLATMKEGDYFKGTHRLVSAPNLIGVPFKAIYAEILAKETGTQGGRTGGNYIADFSKGGIGFSGILGCDMGLACGAALALKLDGTDSIVYNFYGDGTSNRGTVHEAMNLAAEWKLPVLFVCCNNQFAISTDVKESTSVKYPGADRAPGYGMPAEIADGNDVLDVYKKTKKLSEYIREGNGPAVLEIDGYRWGGHFEGDQTKYRDPKRTEEAKKHDCVKIFEQYLIENKVMNEEDFKAVKDKVDKELDDAVQYAIDSKEPSEDTIYDHLFCE